MKSSRTNTLTKAPSLDTVTDSIRIYLGWKPLAGTDRPQGEIDSFVRNGHYRKPFLAAARKARRGARPDITVSVGGEASAFLSRVAKQVRQWHKLTQRQAEQAVLSSILARKAEQLCRA